MSDLLTEVDEVMRQERLAKLWHDHGNTFIAVIAAVILGTAGASGYKAWDEAQRIEGTQNLLTTLNADNFPDNVSPDALEMRSGLKGIALMSAAAKYLEDAQIQRSLDLYRQAAAADDMPGDLLHLAQLKVAELSDDSAADRIKMLDQIIVDENSAWRYQALILRAKLQANDLKAFDAALASLDQILKTPNLSNTLYAKAQSLSHIYRLKSQSSQS